jgi:ElaB/YqjD/DUF883 family membrane-anchored ribosome-binding protein
METHFENLGQAHSLMARERVLADLRSLARDTEDLLKVTAGDVSQKGRELRARLARSLQRAKETGARLQEQTVASAKAAAKMADTVVRDHPYQAIGVAFALGVLIGALVKRR